MLKRLRMKFICINMAIVVALLLTMFGLVYQVTRQDLETESLQAMRSIAAEPFRLGRPGEMEESVHIPYFVLQVGRNGELITAGGYYDLSDEVLLQELLNTVQRAGTEEGTLREYGLRFCSSYSPWGHSVVFADMSGEQSTLNNLVRTCVVIGGISLVAFLLVSIFLARWAVRPVEQAWNQQRQFVADASHELKTPLTVILTSAEMLQGAEQDAAGRQQLTGNILLMTRQMRGLVESLLELARVDNGRVRTAMTELDFSQTVEDAVLPFEPVFFEQGLKLDTQVEGGITLRGSESHLRQVVEILLDNARKYSEEGGAAALYLRRQGRHCLLEVSNTGPAIRREDLTNIFKRFYRVDKARGMDGSYGLGLSIAEGIVEEHQGRIWAESSGGRNTFRVELPVMG